MVDLAAIAIYYCGIAGEFQSVNRLNSPQDIGEFSNAGRFDYDPFRIVSLHDLFQACLKVTFQGAADAAAVDFTDLNACFFQEAAINTDLTKFIFNEHDLLPRKYIFYQF